MISDRVLEYLVQKVEETGIGVNLTLFVKGVIVNGSMIRSKQYYDKVTELLTKKGDISTNDPIEGNILKEFHEDSSYFMKNMIRKSEIDNLKYIHFEVAKIKLPSNSDPILSYLWRCKITSVDAFSMGDAIIPEHN
jgi:hypothetical protein